MSRGKTDSVNNYDIILTHEVAAKAVLSMDIPTQSKMSILDSLGIKYTLIKKRKRP